MNYVEEVEDIEGMEDIAEFVDNMDEGSYVEKVAGENVKKNQ